MNAKAENTPVTVANTSGTDYAIILAGIAIIALGIFGYYHFDGRWANWVRVLEMVGAFCAGLAVIAVSGPGKAFLKFLDAAMLELRKVVWPTKQETTQTTMVVAVAVIAVGILMFIIDFLLAQFVKLTMG